MLCHVHAAERAAADVRNRAAGVVRIGAPLVLASAAVPAAVHAYQLTHPRVVVRVHDLAVDALVDAVAAGDVDLAVGPDRAVPAEVVRHVLFDSLWVLWCAKIQPLARRARLSWADLHGVALVAAGRDHERSVARMQPARRKASAWSLSRWWTTCRPRWAWPCTAWRRRWRRPMWAWWPSRSGWSCAGWSIRRRCARCACTGR
ncbi:LysR substrate-binding domain-containing protein [Pseudorhodoferax sp.]|uniref:LysR substrate-binding domain-containing protein n=1 Tax=Pseudorhodoferax sp. TaxID=1993553 RepID=UPI002DD620B6|nr:LysR substrate-binding domain-containing protein [Pseudorhodoferax sp.]